MEKDFKADQNFAIRMSMKKAIQYLSVGYVCSALIFLNSGIIWELFGFVFSLVMIMGLFCISQANKKLKKAFYLRSSSLAVSCLLYALMADWFKAFNFNIPFGIVIFVLDVLFRINLCSGLYELVKPYESTKPMKKKIDILLAISIVLSCLQLFLFVAYFKDNSYDVGFYGLGFAIYIIALVIVFASFCLFRNISTLLFDSEHEYKTEASASKKFTVVVIAALVGILPAVCVDIGYSLQKAETSVHTIDDSDISQAEYDRICDNLLSYGVPEELVYSLPESEIEKYADSLNLSQLDESTQKYYSQQKGADVNDFDGVITETDSWAIALSDNNVRVLSYIKYVEGAKGFIDGAFWDSSLTSSAEEDEADFVLILSEENGKTVRNEPIETYISENGLPYEINGVCFEAKDGLTVIYAQTFTDNNPGQDYNYIINSFIRKTPFAFFFRTPYEAYYNPKYEVFEYAHNQGFVDFRCTAVETNN